MKLQIQLKLAFTTDLDSSSTWHTTYMLFEVQKKVHIRCKSLIYFFLDVPLDHHFLYNYLYKHHNTLPKKHNHRCNEMRDSVT